MKCPDCDRDNCSLANIGELTAPRGTPRAKEQERRVDSAIRDCQAHKVDWRARALTAEAQVAVARKIVESCYLQPIPRESHYLAHVEHAHDISEARAIGLARLRRALGLEK